MGKGTVALMIAIGIFIFSGYAINIGLGRYLGPEKYGIFGIIISLMTIMNLFLDSGFPKATSKFLSEKNEWNKDVIKKSINAQILFSLIIFFTYFVSARYIAEFLGDNNLTLYIKLSAFAIPFCALNSIYNSGILNGYRLFGKQSISSIGFSMGKIFAISLLTMVGFGIAGAIMGYIIAPFIGFVIAFYYSRKLSVTGNERFPTKKLMQFAIPIILFSVLMFLIFNIDLLSIKAILHENIDTGYYTSATVIARAPYFIFGGLALALLPSISYSSSKNDLHQTQIYITKSLKYMLMLLLPSIFFISATAKPLVTLLYTRAYVSAGEPLQILIIGLGFLAIFNVLSHIVIGSGKPLIASGIAFIIFIIAFILNLYLIPLHGLRGAAIATTIASATGMVVMAAYIYKRFKVLMDLLSFLKILVASLIVFAIAHFIPFHGILLIAEYIALFGFYLFLLRLMKEIRQEDIEIVKRIIHIEIPRLGL